MEKIKAKAIENARKSISNNFKDPAALDDLGTIGLQLEKQLLAVESQLNSVVQGKLDSLKRAVDLMDESAIKLNKLSENILKIDEKIAQTNTSISNYDYLKRVHNARDNLTKVIDQANFFAHVPEKVKELRAKLEENPGALKEVFLESLKLESLRAALLKEIKVNRIRRKSIIGGPDEAGNTTDDTYEKVRRAVEAHLSIVPELVKEVRDAVFYNLIHMTDLADRSPEDLVATFEIVEMQQEYNERRNKANASSRGHDSVRIEYENITITVQDKLREIFYEQVEGEFALLESYVAETSSLSTAVRIIGTQIITKMKNFQVIVMPCMPAHYDPLYHYVDIVETALMPKLQELQTQASSMKVSEILDLLSWLEFLCGSIEDFGFGNRPSITTINAMKGELVIEYKERIKSQVHTWFQNIKKQELEIIKSTDNTLITSNPEDMFNIIHAQISVAKDKLPAEYVKEVAIACLQVLQDVQRQSYDSLIHNFHSMEAETLCAIINDNQRMEEKCREFSDVISRLLRESADRDILEAIAGEVAMEYILIAKQAVNSLAKCIMDVLDEPIYARLYLPEWEGGENLMTVLVVTLQDYFSDLSDWLTYYHFTKLARELLSLVVSRYVMSIRRKVDGSTVFMNELKVSNAIIKDHQTLEEFFEKNIELLQRGGLRSADASGASSGGINSTRSALREELEPISNLAQIISCRTFSNAENSAKFLYGKYGIDGLKTVQACFLMNPALGKAERQSCCDSARKAFDGGKFNSTPMTDYANFDTTLDAVVNAKKESKSFSFWGRKK